MPTKPRSLFLFVSLLQTLRWLGLLIQVFPKCSMVEFGKKPSESPSFHTEYRDSRRRRRRRRKKPKSRNKEMSRNVFECPICFSLYDDDECKPCTFPCGHTCCLKHVPQLANCHECRAALPPIGQLHVNIVLRDAALASNGTRIPAAAAPVSTVDPFNAANIGLKIFQTTPKPFVPTASVNSVLNFAPQCEYDEVDIAVSISSPDSVNTWRSPTDIVIVIDVSGSMSDIAVTADAETANSTLTLLDIVKHAAKTVISSLNSYDRVAIVSFSDRAKIEYPLNFMTQENKQPAIDAVSSLHAHGGTNLYDGLLRSLELLDVRKTGPSGPNLAVGSIILLTDGVPTASYLPPRGILAALRKFADGCGGHLPGIINTFGFGYNLESVLLKEIAEEGNGMYAFIPDAGFVGTAFVNCLSNVLSNVASNAVVKIQSNPNIVIDYEQCGFVNNSTNISDWGFSFNVGTVQAGQSIDPILVKAYVPRGYAGCPIAATLSYDKCVARGERENITDTFEVISTLGGSDELTRQEIKCIEYRIRLINNLTAVSRADFDKAEVCRQNDALSADIVQFIRTNRDVMIGMGPKPMRVSPYARISALNEDLMGQIKMALSREDWFNKWGKHYLPSLRRAHQLQQCNNFKDPGIQHYGGELCAKIRDFSEDIFLKLPPPVPASARHNNHNTYAHVSAPLVGSSRQSQPASVAAPINMAAYNNRDAGCFHEHCLITMQDGSKKQCKDIKRGDILSSGDSVEGIFRSDLSNVDNKIPLVHFEDNRNRGNPVMLTAYHPIRIDGKWQFPVDLVKDVIDTPCTSLFSFVLKNRTSSIVVNDIECITLAHGIECDNVASHSFFGTEKIVEALKSHQNSEWTATGVCTLPCNSFVRDGNNLVVGFN